MTVIPEDEEKMARKYKILTCSSILPIKSTAPFNNPNTTITRVRHGGMTPKGEGKEGGNQMQQHNAPTGSALLDTYLQFITENTFGEFLLCPFRDHSVTNSAPLHY